MRVTPPVEITSITSSTAAEPHVAATYAAGTTYAYGTIVSVLADFTIYESLQAGNIGHTPSTSPLWWRILGPTETAYDVGATYALGDTVSSATTHRIYESLAAGNLGNPLPVLPEITTTKWLDVGPTNKWAMFDMSRNTQTVTTSPMTVVFSPGERVNTLGLTGLNANRIFISATSVLGGGTVYPLAYSASKTYALDDCVTSGGVIYRSLAASNTGNAPPNATWWSTPAAYNAGTTYSLNDLMTSGGNTYMSIANANTGHAAPDAAWWALITNGAVFDLNTRVVNDGYDYAFEPFSTMSAKVVFDLPPYSDIVITVTLTSSSGNVKCGSCVVGTYIYLGNVQYQADNDGVNFSSITRDLYGNATLVPRRTLPKTNQKLIIPSYRVNKATAARILLNAKPALWTGLDDSTSDWFDMLTILGVYKTFKISASSVEDAEINLEVEEI